MVKTELRELRRYKDFRRQTLLRTSRTLAEDGDGHEAEQENEEGEEDAEAAMGIERERIVDGGHAEEAEGEEDSGPKVPDAPALTNPMAVEAEKQEENRKKERQEAMAARAYGTKDVAAIELAGGK
jgi:hypothetical protein